MSFVKTLYSIAHRPDLTDLIHWTEDGSSFWISDNDTFAQQVLFHYYKHRSFTSFIRQLKVYGTCVSECVSKLML